MMTRKYQLLLLLLLLPPAVYFIWVRPVPFDQLYAQVDPATRDSLLRFRQAHPAQSIMVDGLSWEYVALGQGEESILFLHGLAGTYDIWWQQMVALQEDYQVVAVTYAPVDNLAALAGGILAILAAEQIEQVNLVGSSLGGYLAQYLVATHPERIERAVFANTFPPNELIAATYQGVTTLIPYTPEWLIMAVMRGSYRQNIYPTSGNSELVLAFLREKSYGSMSKADLNGRYQCVIEPFTPATTAASNIPLLIIESDNDPLVEPVLRQQLRATYPAASVQSLSGAGHFPYLNRPEEYTEILAAFFGE
jgi:maspardin